MDTPPAGSSSELINALTDGVFDADVPLRDPQILGRHADPRTTEHDDRARDLDRYGVHSLIAWSPAPN